MKVNKNYLRRMILNEMARMRSLPRAGRHAQKGDLRGGGGELGNPHVDYSRLAEVDDDDTLDDTLAGDLEDIEADLGAAEGDLEDIEDNAMAAIKAIYDLAAAAGVELEADVSGPSDVDVDVDIEDVEDVDVEEILQQESRRRARRLLLRKLSR